MKKTIASLLTIASLFVMGGYPNPKVSADEAENSLIEYIETHEIESYAEFVDVIRDLSPESVDVSEDIDNITSFVIDVDYDCMLVSVTTVRDVSYSRASGASNSASKSYYEANGTKLFTVTINGTFRYTSGSCSTVSASGSFARAGASSWSSTPLVTSGNINTRIAYARISGTATYLSSSVYYSLTLTCNDSGNFTSY